MKFIHLNFNAKKNAFNTAISKKSITTVIDFSSTNMITAAAGAGKSAQNTTRNAPYFSPAPTVPWPIGFVLYSRPARITDIAPASSTKLS